MSDGIAQRELDAFREDRRKELMTNPTKDRLTEIHGRHDDKSIKDQDYLNEEWLLNEIERLRREIRSDLKPMYDDLKVTGIVHERK